MPLIAQIYIYGMVSAAAITVALSATNLQLDNPVRLAAYLALTAAASTLKIRLPHMLSSITPGFLFVLLAVADFPLAETSLVSLVAGLVQTLWKPNRKPKAIQVAFNAATITVCAAVAHATAQSMLPGADPTQGLGRLAVALVTLFFLNVSAVSLVLCLIEGKPLSSIFRAVNYWAFPYYIAGTVIAVLFQYTVPFGGWALAQQLPAVYLVHLYFSESMSRNQRQGAQAHN